MSSAHTCHAAGCDEVVPRRMFMCRRHWAMIPKKMQQRVWAEYTPGQERLSGKAWPSDEYIRVTIAIIDWLRRHEGRDRHGRMITYVLVTGDRKWKSPAIIATVLRSLPGEWVLVQGDAPGADSIAKAVADRLGIRHDDFPALWEQQGRAAGPIRNRKMLDHLLAKQAEGHPVRVIAFHHDLTQSKGTANMVKIAKKAKIRVTHVKGLKPR